MRPFALQTCHNSLRQFTRPAFSHTRIISKTRITNMSTGVPPSASLNIETKDIPTAPGVTISEEQRTIIGSVLDLFAGHPSLKKLALWRDDATFTDPLTIAKGRNQYAAQWYGLKQAFSEIEQLSRQVTDAGNPILMDLKARYVVKGINKEQTIQSVVAIHLDEQGKISKVEDRWNGSLPDGAISNAFRHLNAVSVPLVVNVPKTDEEDAKKGN